MNESVRTRSQSWRCWRVRACQSKRANALNKSEVFEDPPRRATANSDDSAVRGWRNIHVSNNDGGHPYMENWWVPGTVIGFEHSFIHGVYQFLKSLEGGDHERQFPTFADAMETDKICAAILESSKSQTWQTIE